MHFNSNNLQTTLYPTEIIILEVLLEMEPDRLGFDFVKKFII